MSQNFVKLFFYVFFRAHPLRVCTRLLLQMMRLPAASDYMGRTHGVAVTRGFTPGCDIAPIQGAGGMRHYVARQIYGVALARATTRGRPKDAAAY